VVRRAVQIVNHFGAAPASARMQMAFDKGRD